MVENKPLGQFENRVIHPTEMGEFRKKMLEISYIEEGIKEDPSSKNPSSLINDIDDF